jgi:hypothetical protein
LKQRIPTKERKRLEEEDTKRRVQFGIQKKTKKKGFSCYNGCELKAI